jgi:hypothetical protein
VGTEEGINTMKNKIEKKLIEFEMTDR